MGTISCGHGNEVFGSREGGEFLDQSRDYQFLKRNSATRMKG
jgi:hypothetical protein